MKRLFLMLFAATVCTMTANAVVFSHSAHFEFAAGSAKSLTLFNRQGKIEIDRVAGNREISVNVQITCNTGSETEAKSVFEGICIESSQNGTSASVYTSAGRGKKLKQMIKGINYSVDYHVTVPWGIDLKIFNADGTVIIPNYSDGIELQTENCNVFIGDIESEKPCSLTVRKGSCVMKNADVLQCDFDACKYEIGDVNELRLKAKNGTGTITSATLFQTSLAGGSLKIGTVEDISGNTSDCKLSIGDLGDCMTLETERGNLKVDNIHLSFDKIAVNSVWTDVTFAFMADAGYTLTLQHDKRLKVALPAELRLSHQNSPGKNIIIGSGYYGNTSRKSEVRLKMNGGTLAIK